MKNYCILITFIALSIQHMFAQNDTIWYNNNWGETTKEKAAYFRPEPKPVNDGYLLKDYYISGALQMEGFSTTKNYNSFEGLVKWYEENGQPSQEANYSNNKLNGTVTSYYKGNVFAKAHYKNGKVERGTTLYYSKAYNYHVFSNYKDGVLISEKVFSEMPGEKILMESNIKPNNDQKLFQTKYYDKGKLVGTFERSAYDSYDHTYYNGTRLEYYYNPTQKKKAIQYDHGSLKGYKLWYASGKLREQVIIKNDTAHTTYYNETGKEIASLTSFFTPDEEFRYLYDKPINGTQIIFKNTIFFNDAPIIQHEKKYSDGFLQEQKNYRDDGSIETIQIREKSTPVKDIVYDENGNIEHQLIYKYGVPYEGTEARLNGSTISIYKEGKVVERIRKYKNGAIFEKENEDQSIFYDPDGNILGKLEYKHGEYAKKPYTGTQYQIDYNGNIYTVNTYKEGINTQSIKYSSDDKNTKQSETFYNEQGIAINKNSFYKGGALKEALTLSGRYQDRKKAVFYNQKGEVLATMIYQPTMHGTEYVFFNDTDIIKSIKTYDENGKVTYKKNYDKDYSIKSTNGKYPILLTEEIDYNGKALFYDRKGKLLAQATYKDGSPWEGVVKKGGFSSYTLIPYQNGKKNGEETKYISYGGKENILQEKRNYRDNELNGKCYLYYENGQVQRVTNHKNGDLDGETIFYKKDGTEKSKITYKDGSPWEGVLTTIQVKSRQKTIKKSYYKAGNLTKAEKWENDILLQKTIYGDNQLEITDFDTNGEITAYYSITNVANKTGEIHYYSNGKVKEKGIFKNGIPISGIFRLNSFFDFEKEFNVTQVLLEVAPNMYTVRALDKDKNTLIEIAENKKLNKHFLMVDLLNPKTFYSYIIPSIENDTL